MEAYIRVGNESVIAPDYIVNELILKGTNQSFDTLTTDAMKKDYSFTLLEATYLERTGLRFEPSDYVSFGLADKNGFLTNAGKLMTDQHTVYNSRMFCTRWNGLEKGSIFDDALDDKEYEGNLIYLLKSGSEFIRNNSKVRFVKEAQYRVDKPDYAERAVTETLVNALIHRDYIVLGSEVHIDMFDDRVEITSPGGMFGGGSIQEYDIYSIRSMRRNPVIVDLFHRMKYMERRGSGLRKIVRETEKLPGYTEAYKPEFSSTATDFRVILKNVRFLVSALQAGGSRVIISSIPPVDAAAIAHDFPAHRIFYREDDRFAFNAALRRIAAETGAVFNDMEPLYRAYAPQELTIDGIHLNRGAQRLLAGRVLQCMQALRRQ